MNVLINEARPKISPEEIFASRTPKRIDPSKKRTYRLCKQLVPLTQSGWRVTHVSNVCIEQVIWSRERRGEGGEKRRKKKEEKEKKGGKKKVEETLALRRWRRRRRWLSSANGTRCQSSLSRAPRRWPQFTKRRPRDSRRARLAPRAGYAAFERAFRRSLEANNRRRSRNSVRVLILNARRPIVVLYSF